MSSQLSPRNAHYRAVTMIDIYCYFLLLRGSPATDPGLNRELVAGNRLIIPIGRWINLWFIPNPCVVLHYPGHTKHFFVNKMWLKIFCLWILVGLGCSPAIYLSFNLGNKMGVMEERR